MYLTTEFVILECIACNVTYALTVEFNRKKREDHTNFYCPKGHPQRYPEKSDKEKLEEKLSKAQANFKHEQQCCINAHEETNAIERKLRATKGVVTKLKNKRKNK